MDEARVKELRGHLGLSQERFAHLLGVSLQTVRRWELGLTRPLPIIGVKLEEMRREAGISSARAGVAAPTATRRRAEAGAEVGLGGLFRGLGNVVDLVSRMEEGKEEFARSGEATALGGKVKGVYGFSVRLGLEGRPVIEQFGNIRETETGALVSEAREPLVDVLDEGEWLRVIVELPGIEEQDILAEVKGSTLEIAAATRERKYHKQVLLPSAVDSKGQESAYRNGILEIKLPKVTGSRG